jgi:hypothetical protein
MKTVLSILIVTFCISMVSAQVTESEISSKKHPFVNITEVGGMFGRVENPVYYYPYFSPNYASYSSYAPPNGEQFEIRNVANISLQTFNGVYINTKTAVGFTTGLDWYNNTLIVPLELGIRRQLAQRKNGGAAIIAGMNAG